MAATFEYWYVTLPSKNPRLKGESVEDHANRELNLLASQGWEVINATRPEVIGAIGFMLRRSKA